MEVVLAVLQGIDYALRYSFVKEPSWTRGGFIQFTIDSGECFAAGLVLGRCGDPG
jgi:hypothetical protein